MAQERGAELRVRDVRGRLGAGTAGGWPLRVGMTADPTGGAQGGETTAWSVGLVP